MQMNKHDYDDDDDDDDDYINGNTNIYRSPLLIIVS